MYFLYNKTLKQITYLGEKPAVPRADEIAIEKEIPTWLDFATTYYIKQGTDISALSYGEQKDFCSKAIYRQAQCKADARWDYHTRLLILLGKHETPATELEVFHAELVAEIDSLLLKIEDANTDLVEFFNTILKTLK